MTSPRPAHPLDVDLADLVDGLVDGNTAAAIEAHLADCVLCRLKQWRLTSAPPAAAGGRPFLSPAFALVAFDDGGEPAPGEIWLAGGDERILVLVLRTAGDRVLVAPVTLDVEAADDEAEIVGSPLGPVVVYPALAAELPRSVLAGRLPGLVDRSGAIAGPAIAGAGDPRLELRQHLADRLGTLEGVLPDPSDDAPPPLPEQIRSTLIADLRALRDAACVVRSLDTWPDVVVADREGWMPLATVDEVGVVLVVLDTPHGLVDDADFDTARAVLTRFNASALVVLAGELSDQADVFDASSLNHGIDMPSGTHTPPRPLIAGLVAFDAIAKYLDQHSGARALSSPARGPVAYVDVAALLRDAAAGAAADAVKQGARFKILPKRQGYESLVDATATLGAALGAAFTDASVVEALLELSRRDDAG